jgi:hypothetical protein
MHRSSSFSDMPVSLTGTGQKDFITLAGVRRTVYRSTWPQPQRAAILAEWREYVAICRPACTSSW